MTARDTFLRWQSSADPAVTALEWLAGEPSAGRLRRALAAVPARDASPAFVLVGHPGAVGVAGLATSLPASTRLVLAVGHDGLDTTARELGDAAGVGLLLDGVDLDTPLRALVHPRLEAIRFRPDFVDGAERDLRIACALEALLGLARDCGCATLGPARAPNDDWLAPEIAFDLVPSYRIDPAHGRAPFAAAREPAAPEFQLSR